MIESMTGYGRGEARLEAGALLVELRSLNHRYLEVLVRGDVTTLGLEERIRRTVSRRFQRGRIEARLEVETRVLSRRRVVIDVELARQYREQLHRLGRELGLEGSAGMTELLALSGLVELREEGSGDEAAWRVVEPVLAEAVAALGEARRQEGAVLARDMARRVAAIETALAGIAGRADRVRDAYRQRLVDRLREWRTDQALPAERVEAEAVLYAERSDIAEELVRLESHLAAFRAALTGDGPVGRQLEFILQELHREINTVGAKAKDAAIGAAVVAIKSELEKLREQAKNIE